MRVSVIAMAPQAITANALAVCSFKDLLFLKIEFTVFLSIGSLPWSLTKLLQLSVLTASQLTCHVGLRSNLFSHSSLDKFVSSKWEHSKNRLSTNSFHLDIVVAEL